MDFKKVIKKMNCKKKVLIKFIKSKMNQFLNIIIMTKEIDIKKSKITIIIKIININLFYHQNYILEIIMIY